MELMNEAADSGVRWNIPTFSKDSKTASALFLTFMYESLQVMIVGAFSATASGIDVPLWAISNKRLSFRRVSKSISPRSCLISGACSFHQSICDDAASWCAWCIRRSALWRISGWSPFMVDFRWSRYVELSDMSEKIERGYFHSWSVITSNESLDRDGSNLRPMRGSAKPLNVGPSVFQPQVM